MANEPQDKDKVFSRWDYRGRLQPGNELRVVETKITRHGTGQINVDTVIEDEFGVRWEITGFSGGSVCGTPDMLTPWPTDIHATYHLLGKGWNTIKVVANSYDEAVAEACKQHTWHKPEDFKLDCVTAPPKEEA